jgi:hypothetical protein
MPARPQFRAIRCEVWVGCSVRTRSLARTPATEFTFTRCASAAFASHFPYHIRTTRHETSSHPTVSPALTHLSTTLSTQFVFFLTIPRFISLRHRISSTAFGIPPFTHPDEPKRHCDCISTDLADRADPSYIVDFALARTTTCVSTLSRPSYICIVSHLSWTYVRKDFTDLIRTK